MRCWYCYERHHADRTMTAEVAERVFKFVERKLAEPELKHFNLAFFGGEPLVEFQSVVKPLVDHTCAVADRLGKEVGLSFTTNGYLLTPDVLQYLTDTGAPSVSKSRSTATSASTTVRATSPTAPAATPVYSTTATTCWRSPGQA